MSGDESPIRVGDVAAESDAFESVKALSKLHQSLLGQFGWEAFESAANAGRLLGAWNDVELIGYCMYSFRKRDRAVILTQVCVADGWRGHGVARRLIDAAIAGNPFASAVIATCRADYDAAKMWPTLHFARVGTTRGRKKSGSTLERWVRRLDDGNLFAHHDDERLVAAVDSDVVRDILEPRSDFVASVALADDWVNAVADLVTVPHVETEINRAAEQLPQLHGMAGSFRQLRPDADEADAVRSRITNSGVPQSVGPADRLNLAQASAGRADFFVTRDQRMLGNASTLRNATSVEILSPADLLLRLHADTHADEYQPSSLVRTPIEVSVSSAIPTTQALTGLVDAEVREPARGLHSLLESCAAATERGGRVIHATTSDGATVAVVAERRSESGQALVVDALRVATNSDRYAISRQLVHMEREHCIEQDLTSVAFHGHVPDYVAMALRYEGFTYGSDGWSAACDRRVLRSEEQSPDPTLGRTVGDLSASSVSRLERERWPLKLFSGHTPTYVVPIRPGWAQELFDHDPPQGVLKLRDRRLGLAREHVYYRSKANYVQAPARLLWYVSTDDPNAGVRACSWLEATTSDRPGTLFRRFGGQGVYTRPDIELAAGTDGLATALSFSRTELFRNHLTLQKCREIVPEFRGDGFLTTTRPVLEHVFDLLYQEGSPQR